MKLPSECAYDMVENFGRDEARSRAETYLNKETRNQSDGYWPEVLGHINAGINGALKA